MHSPQKNGRIIKGRIIVSIKLMTESLNDKIIIPLLVLLLFIIISCFFVLTDDIFNNSASNYSASK